MLEPSHETEANPPGETGRDSLEDTTSPRTSQFAWVAILFEGGLLPLAFVLGFILGVNPLAPWRWELVSFAWGVVAAVVPLLALVAGMRLRWKLLEDLVQAVNRVLGPWLRQGRWWQFVLVSLLAGLGEEALFRGALQSGGARFLGTPAAWVLSSVIFGLAHKLTTVYAVLAMGMGLYLGALYWWTDNMLAPVTTHALYDLGAFVLLVRRVAELPDESSEEL